MLCSVPKVAERLGLSLEEAGQLVAKMPVLLTLDPRLLVLGMNGEGWVWTHDFACLGGRRRWAWPGGVGAVDALGRCWFQVHAWVGRQAFKGVSAFHKALRKWQRSTWHAHRGWVQSRLALSTLPFQEDLLTCDLRYRPHNSYERLRYNIS